MAQSFLQLSCPLLHAYWISTSFNHVSRLLILLKHSFSPQTAFVGDDNSNLDSAAASDSSKPPSSSCIQICDNQLFHVELRPGEITIVSWKKLLKDAKKANEGFTSAAPEQVLKANPALEARMALRQAENNEQDVVIEKIKRFYMGKDSEDEDLPVVPDDQ